MQLARTRSLFFLVFIACAMIIGSVVYLQCAVVGLSPCVLCVWQRAVFVGSGLVALVATFHAPGQGGCRAYSAVILLSTLVGAAIAGGQVWLQTATVDQAIEVIAHVERLLDRLSLYSQVDRLRSDATFCAEISWSLFGISLPEWSLLGFVGLALVMLYALLSASVRAPSAESRAGD